MQLVEAIFLKKHPLGPKMRTNAVAQLMNTSEYQINLWCLTDWEDLKRNYNCCPIEQPISDDYSTEESEYYSDDGQSPIHFEHLGTEEQSSSFELIQKLGERIGELERQVTYQNQLIEGMTSNLNSHPYIATPSSSTDMLDSCHSASSIIQDSFPKAAWISACKREFIDFLLNEFSFIEDDLNVISEKITRIYNPESFTDEMHMFVMSSVAREIQKKGQDMKMEQAIFAASNTDYDLASVLLDVISAILEEYIEQLEQ